MRVHLSNKIVMTTPR